MIGRTPYARMLGIEVIAADPDTVALRMAARPELEGRQGFLYGGVIASLLELACLEAIAQRWRVPWPKPVNISFDFLRGGLMIDSFAEARISRAGRNVINVDAIGWQADREKPIATARMHLLQQEGREP